MILVEKKRSCSESELPLQCHVLQSLHETKTNELCFILKKVFADIAAKETTLDYSPK